MSNLKKDPKQTYLKITDAVVGVDEDGCLINFDPTIFAGDINGNIMTISYRYSNSVLEPLNPDDATVGVWGDYALNSQWMAMQERINNILMEWKVFKIKGVKGDKGDPGEKGDTGTPGAPGGIGGAGQASFHSFAYKRSDTQPETPTDGSYNSPIPSTWSNSFPTADGNPVWVTSRLFTSDGLSPQHPAWSVPAKIADSDTAEYQFSNFTGSNPGNPTFPLNGATWHTTGIDEDVWMAVRAVKNGANGLWSVIKIKGVDGEVGQSSFKSIVFKRSANNIPITTKPIGGTFAAPVPSGWSDGIPAGVGSVYQSTRIFSSDGQPPQDATWSTPALAVDTIYKDYEYSSNITKPGDPTNEPAAWHNDPLEDDIWQAIRDNNNGVFGSWTIQRIKGEAGAPGLGYTVISNNPIYSIAVGSDGIASIAKQAVVSINVYRDALLLSPSPSPTGLNQYEFHVILPTSLPSGITVTKDSDNTLRFNIAAGTVLSETKNISIPLKVGLDLIDMNSVFSVVPITTAEDGEVLILSASSNVVSFDGSNNLVSPTSITFNVNQQNYSETTTWVSDPVGIVSGTGLTKTVNTSSFFTSNNAIKITVSTPNGLFDSTTILKVRDGLPGSSGPPGLNGTAGPIVRTFEWVVGGVYENTTQFIDYVYYRDIANPGVSASRGWYTVIKVGGVDTTAPYNVGVPNPLKFVKAPFSDQMTFSLIIAEQANLAGFIFRNQVLYSQAISSQNCGGVLSEYPNLTIDGLQGIIKFLERMILDKNGITMKDDCGRQRMLFKWESGIPILRFLDENGNITWEAGQGGYIVVASEIPESYTTIKAISPSGTVSVTPTVANIPANIFQTKVCSSCGDNDYKSFGNTDMDTILGYQYNRGTTTVSPSGSNGKIFTTASYGGTQITDGWYITNATSYYGVFDSGTGKSNVLITFVKITDGKIVQNVEVEDVIENYFVWPCGTHSTPSCS